MEKIKKVFEKLKTATTIDVVDNILNEIGIDKKYRISNNVYPKIKFTISKEEIQELKNKNIFNQDNSINDDANLDNLDALGKLLYAIAWKNRNLPKIKHIIEGIISEEEKDRDKGLVFYQFGKHLSNRNQEPIIDQHVLRAYALYRAERNEHNAEPIRKSNAAKRKNELIEAYKNWLQTGLTDELRKCDNCNYHVDKVLFALGKYAKSKSLS